MSTFGKYIREKRLTLQKSNPSLSVRQVAKQIGVQPAYLSKVEREEVAPPSEAKIVALAQILKEDPDALLAMAGKISTDIREIIMKQPKHFARLIRQLRDLDHTDQLYVMREGKVRYSLEPPANGQSSQGGP
jgi:transcriptional regulator with XRE-family HTH domain